MLVRLLAARSSSSSVDPESKSGNQIIAMAAIAASSSWITRHGFQFSPGYLLPESKPSKLLASVIKPSSSSSSSNWPFLSVSGGYPTRNHRNMSVYSSGNEEIKSENSIAVLLEVEGVLMDIYRWGNRQAFNKAFQKLGLDCANWTEPIYLDLVRKSSGEEERMLVLFFNRIGWPTSLPTNEKESFMKSVIREKRNALDEFLLTKSLPLRPGLEEFIDDAHAEDIPVVILTAYSRYGDKISRSIIEKLGEERISKVKIIGKEEVEGSFYGQLVLSKSESNSLDEQLAKAARKAALAEKYKVAEEVASMLNVSVNLGGSTTTERSEKFVATLRAAAECVEVPVKNCVLVAGGQAGLAGAETIGMPCVILRSSLTSRTEFPSASAVMDGFGGADLTVSRLRQKGLSQMS